jgi:RND family efflux transporter MFP subunit
MRYLLVLVALTAGCGGGSKTDQAKPAVRPKPIAVSTVAVQSQDWPAVREVTGSVRARTTAMIASKIMAYVSEVRVNVGDSVRAGHSLLVLDSKDLDAALRQAEGARAEARGAEAELNSAIDAAKAQLDLARATHKRMQDLLQKKSISTQEFDEASARLRQAEAGYEMAQSRKRQLAHRIEQADAAAENASIMKSYAVITAPFAGVITEKRVEPGNLVHPGAPLLTVEQSGAYRLEVSVEESLLPLLRVGQSVSIAIESIERSAPIQEIVPSVDAASRAFTVKIALPPHPLLRSGMFGRARIPAGATRSLAIPAAALHRKGSLELVFVAEKGVARARIVTVGERKGEAVRVHTGLSEGEQLIHPLPADLTDGAPVEVRP